MYLKWQIHNEIERKREELIEAGLSLGLDNQLTIKYSQELDFLINQYQKMKVKPKYSNQRFLEVYDS
ncbi:MAG TPA: aspartyl-phosphate phosphatase Spo0E family protein [Massilibacterium sp.]|nr:aspartyl-phosphate phosphatase Spo0E family protein [Massilibacterium sp.]